VRASPAVTVLGPLKRALYAACDEAGDVATASLLDNWIDQSLRRSWVLFEATGLPGLLYQ
jgi:hypothetical protein